MDAFFFNSYILDLLNQKNLIVWTFSATPERVNEKLFSYILVNRKQKSGVWRKGIFAY